MRVLLYTVWRVYYEYLLDILIKLDILNNFFVPFFFSSSHIDQSRWTLIMLKLYDKFRYKYYFNYYKESKFKLLQWKNELRSLKLVRLYWCFCWSYWWCKWKYYLAHLRIYLIRLVETGLFLLMLQFQAVYC